MNKKVPFEKLSDADKRVRIAKDVIAQIMASRLKPKEGVYLQVKVLAKDDEQVDALLKRAKKAVKPCAVCALGGIFACTAIARDKVTADDVGSSLFREDDWLREKPIGFDADGVGIKEYLSDLFDHEQLSLIECAFEQDAGFGVASWEGRYAAVDFGERYKTARGRMLAIMKNIVDNGGTFVPEAK